MTEPREKTREELTAEIEESKKKSGSIRTGRKSSSLSAKSNMPLAPFRLSRPSRGG